MRNYNIDLIKLIACLGVLLEHASVRMYFEGNIFSTVLYNFGMMAVPLFFMCSGFFMLNKKCSWSNLWIKIKKIGLFVFFWGGCYFLATIPFKGCSFGRLIDNIFGPFLQRGFFDQLWFLGALILLYLLQPFLMNIKQSHYHLYLLLFGCVLIISMIVNVISLVNGHFIAEKVPQTLRLWSWISYFMLGDLIRTYATQIKIRPYQAGITIIIILASSYLIEYCEGINKNEYVYDSLFIHIYIAIIFIFLLKYHLSPKQIEIIKYLTPYMVGIYLFQQTFRRIYYIVFPLSSIWNQCLLIIFMLMGSVALTWIVNHTKLRQINQI